MSNFALVPPVSSGRSRSADAAPSKLMLVVSATPVRWSVPTAAIAAGARAAREQRLPLLIRIALSGADAGEGVGARRMGRRRQEDHCELRALDRHRERPHRGRPSPDARPRRPRDHDLGGLRLRLGANDGGGIHGRSHEQGGARRPSVHDRTSGVASFVAGDEEEAEALAAELLAFLLGHTDDHPPTSRLPTRSSGPPDAYEVLPPSANGSYDVRDIVGAVVDDGYLLGPMPTGRPTWSRRSPRSADSRRYRGEPTPNRRWNARYPGEPERRPVCRPL